MNLLLVEENFSMRAALECTLTRRGILVTSCADREQALPRWRELRPDVVLVDHVDVLVKAREQGLRAPVMVLTARSTASERVRGLNAGADDWLSHPWDPDELEARVRALARRAPHGSRPGARIGNLRMDADSGAFYAGERLLELTQREAALLRALAARPGRAVAKERLFDAVFAGDMDVRYDAIEVVVYRVRKKLAGTGAALVTLRGLGYLLDAE